MSDMNENTNPMSVAEPLQPAESAATWLDAVNQAAETAAADVTAASSDLYAAAQQAQAPAAAPNNVFTLPTIEEPARPQSARAAAAPTASYDVTSDDKLMAALSWLGMVLLQIPLVSTVLLLAEGNKDRPFQRHHALQSIGLFVAAIAYEFVAAILFTVGSVVTLGCGALFLWVLFFVPHIMAVYYAWQAYQGKEINIPVVSQVMRQQGWLR
ncbi:hypothetical protein [Candidatus Amarolinea dominans]|uniref:DUF4870 domain-containing protein n=1 Tax=Candidatus Amarolinea dominans TaxID=3140696 RepID=UPI001D7F6B44|nr:hypothetical protein [Anaerolineae bacterium]